MIVMVMTKLKGKNPMTKKMKPEKKIVRNNKENERQSC